MNLTCGHTVDLEHRHTRAPSVTSSLKTILATWRIARQCQAMPAAQTLNSEILSRFRCGRHWLRCAMLFRSSNPNEQSCPAAACLEGRVCGKHETEDRFIFNCDAYHDNRRSQKYCPLFADLETETIYAFYHKIDYSLIAKFLLQCNERGPRSLGIMTLTSGHTL